MHACVCVSHVCVYFTSACWSLRPCLTPDQTPCNIKTLRILEACFNQDWLTQFIHIYNLCITCIRSILNLMTLSWPKKRPRSCEKSFALHADANQQIHWEECAKCGLQGPRPCWLWTTHAGVMNFHTQADSIDHNQQINRIFVESKALL